MVSVSSDARTGMTEGVAFGKSVTRLSRGQEVNEVFLGFSRKVL